MKGSMIKLYNKRISVIPVIAINDDNSRSLMIEARRLIEYKEIPEFKEMPTVRMEIKKNIVYSTMLLSEEASYNLYKLLENYFNNKNHETN